MSGAGLLKFHYSCSFTPGGCSESSRKTQGSLMTQNYPELLNVILHHHHHHRQLTRPGKQ